MVRAYLGLGTNLGNRKENLAIARENLEESCASIKKVSPVYLSAPMGFSSNNDFYNQVVEISTEADAFDLLDHIQEIEIRMGRTRSGRGYSDRIIDIDILFYENEIISSKPLIIPHPLLHKRMFVLQPMADIAPAFVHPVFNKSITELIKDCNDSPATQL
jgi:2-amino-4-hydroxy-6-hydroxymethyldihydropteridine diphosphokinase